MAAALAAATPGAFTTGALAAGILAAGTLAAAALAAPPGTVAGSCLAAHTHRNHIAKYRGGISMQVQELASLEARPHEVQGRSGRCGQGGQGARRARRLAVPAHACCKGRSRVRLHCERPFPRPSRATFPYFPAGSLDLFRGFLVPTWFQDGSGRARTALLEPSWDQEAPGKIILPDGKLSDLRLWLTRPLNQYF